MMSFKSKQGESLDGLQDLPQSGLVLTAKSIAKGCATGPVLSRTRKVSRIGRLMEAGAWTDAALALIELELPQWKLRRLVFDHGEWFCSLSRQPNLPAELDETADASHQVLPLAILQAALEAERKARIGRNTRAPTVPQVPKASRQAVCCDNFA
jgi:hypothetical protein